MSSEHKNPDPIDEGAVPPPVDVAEVAPEAGAPVAEATPARDDPRPWIGDLVGGLAGLAVALPQAMGLGIALFAAMGLGSSSGALAGLIGLAAISLVSGIGGNTGGMISAPNGPVVIFLIGALASVAAAGVAPGDLPTALAVLVVLAGVFQLVLGVSGGGQLIKFIPYQVVAGLVTAIGLLMMASQVPNLFGGAEGVAELMGILGSLLIEAPGPGGIGFAEHLPDVARLMVPAVVAATTLVGIYLIPNRLPGVPPIVGGFVVGMVVFHGVTAMIPGPIPTAWIVGAIPGPDSLALNVTRDALLGLPWDVMIVSGLALAVVASIDCMVTAVVADAATGRRHDSKRELMAQGIGQITAGLCGGCGGGGTKGATLTAIRAGGRGRPAVFAALGIIALVLLLRPLGLYLPVSVLAGVVIHVGFSMVDWRIASWLRSPKARVDGVLALSVIAAAVIFDVTTGVGVGAIGSALLFIRGQSSATAIHERATGKERRSLSHRSKSERALLDAHGERILYIELRGHLFFGSVDRLFTELNGDLRRPVWIVINMRRVLSLDMSGLNLLHQMMALIAAHGGQILFANIYPGIAPNRKMGKLLRLLGPGDKGIKARTFKSSDKALQCAEDELLTELTGSRPTGPSKRVEADQNELCRSMRPKTKATLRKILKPVDLRPKERFYSTGDNDHALFFVVQGEVDVRLPTDRYHYKRLKRVGPGGFFGEMTFLNPGARVTTAVAIGEVEAMALDPDAVKADDPGVKEAIKALQIELAFELAEQMRWASTEISRLERW